ncbi:RidA family protein [Acinetobacter baumannii]|uniref:RidA family protein n=1 Tax=Acinetobacter pittii TaxID=48296 RepID=UPI00233F5BE2|nr:RidA family protein [Acinetobacter baumannii]MDC5525997.1 RidA family protein [Acinetobacter baumannii]MDC5540546.1 RidA family protein [Acinetobacter baumannii]MDC5675538.1 RidA family protein [Acinetobacter baumannii]MDC5686382.1 RidA family protein [Acinetobacter baumannii]
MKEIICTKHAPEAIGPYSQGIGFQNLIFTSGQLPLIPETMQFPEGGIRAQTYQSLQNVKSILEAQNSSLEYVIKTTCFLADMTDFAEFNEVYQEFFGTNNPPARSCVEAARLPKDALVEIEVIAFKP